MFRQRPIFGIQNHRRMTNLVLQRFPLLTVFCLLFHFAGAQQCEFRVLMEDIYGDGWNDGLLTVTSGSDVYTFTLLDGYDSTVTFSTNTGAPLKLSWATGEYDDEVTLSLFNNDGDLLYTVTEPGAGTLYEDTAQCVECLRPLNVVIENVYDTRARIRWTPGVGIGMPAGWWVIYGPPGFTPGPGAGDSLYAALPKATITGLEKKTFYDFYVQQDCGNGQTGSLSGPYTFETYRSDDVGISGIVSPESGCDLGVETVTIRMSNYGANPLSLIPFNYSVNGIPGGVPQPQDGFYTGVIGKDSTTAIEFETMYDFSGPGEYLIEAWTEMEGDEFGGNDTFRIRIVNYLVAPYEQDFETWSGGWYVDTSAAPFSTWEFGIPNTDGIPAAASGQNAWVTNLDGDYAPGELSYLNSPCFDFSDLANDPVIEFSLIYVTEFDYDGGFLEMSVDDGDNWVRVGAIGEGLNWYNFDNENTDLGHVWSGESGGWLTARHRLPGAAGQASVRLRFGIGADAFVHFDGMGIDDVRVFEPAEKDLAGFDVQTEAENDDCGKIDDTVLFRFINLGSQPQTLFEVSYALNGAAAVTENVGAVTVQPDEVFEYIFTTPFDSRDGVFEIKCWTNLADDGEPANDTTTYMVDHLPGPVPVFEDFEAGFPAGWSSNGSVTSGHNNASQVLFLRMNNSNQTFTADMARAGFISPGDSLSFDYRFVNFAGGGTAATTLGGNTRLEVLISTDCGENFQTAYTINATNHTPSVALQTAAIDLMPYIGLSVLVRFRGVWNAGDFYLDLDNINIRACAPDMQLSAETVPADPGEANGSAAVNVGLGNPPYQYVWNTGDSTQTVTGLSTGAFTVTVTDDFGCSGVLNVFIGNSSANEIPGLARFALQPNPTAGTSTLFVALDHTAEVQVQVIDLTGRLIWSSAEVRSDNLSEPLDLSKHPDGLYLIRLTADGRSVTRKLVKKG